jgi:methyltransferase (TIGR00027 family)
VLEHRASLTARWVAAQRARLSAERPTLPHGDAEAEGRLYRSLGRVLTLPGLHPTGMQLRTGFIDAEVCAAIERGVEQVVIVGAGYDGRALRFGGGGVRWIEIDHPATQADKRRRLEALGAPLDHIQFAPIDLIAGDLDHAFAVAGHDPRDPTVFVCEGLFPYLPPEVGAEVRTTLRRRATHESVLATNFLVSPAVGLVGRTTTAFVDATLSVIGERRRCMFGPGDPERLLADAGWTVVRRAESVTLRGDGGSHQLLVAAEPRPG